ncbi:uncharacterized protein LOC133200114 isoform X2 [Saccostrea echinata]|uniref:uncharacterized protein LOC133200114 isoform X2 n=1 Tax=Saccostrea echinata TaxID=191078 RepID=UPI002A7F0382|nr:uncharacterized protein LOC133200114 isoform X2 [Saccostrea echinata]
MKPGSNGHIQREDIMMNLLDDSSETDELQLPPLKGKKQVRRKRIPYAASTSPGGGVCNLWQFIKMLVFLLLVCSVTVMGFITVWLSNQVNDLQQQLSQVKGHSLQTTMEDLQQQIQNDIKKALVNITKSPQEIEAIKQRMITLTSKMDTLSTAVAAVGNSQPGSKQIVNEVNTLTTQVPVISKTVANLGVDVKTMKSTVDDLINFKKNVEKELAEIKLHEEPASGGQESGGRESSHVDLNTDISSKIQKLGDMIQIVNNSLWSELPKIQSKLSSHEVYLLALQNITAKLQKDLTSLTGDHSSIMKDHKDMGDGPREGTEQTKVLIHQVIEDMGLANRTSPSKSLDDLSLKIDDITASVGTLKSQFKLMKESQNGFGLTDADSIKTSLQALNQSVEVLKTDLHTLMSKVTKQSNAVTKLTKTVEVLQHFSASLDKDHRDMLKGQMTTTIPANHEIKTTATSSAKLQPEAVTTKKLPISTTVAPNPDEKKSEGLGNKSPQAITDGQVTVTLPVNEIVLSGVNSTDDKNIMLYHWEQISGPTSLKITQQDEAITTATGHIVAGQYVFELQVWDEENLTSKAQLTVDVKDKDSGGDSDKSTTRSVSSIPPAPLHKFIDMTLVKTYDDLDLGVRRWDKNGDGLVDADDLKDYMPDPPLPQQLEKFDFNHDGLYSIDELAVALGFQPWPKDQPQPVDNGEKH